MKVSDSCLKLFNPLFTKKANFDTQDHSTTTEKVNSIWAKYKGTIIFTLGVSALIIGGFFALKHSNIFLSSGAKPSPESANIPPTRSEASESNISFVDNYENLMQIERPKCDELEKTCLEEIDPHLDEINHPEAKDAFRFFQERECDLKSFECKNDIHYRFNSHRARANQELNEKKLMLGLLESKKWSESAKKRYFSDCVKPYEACVEKINRQWQTEKDQISAIFYNKTREQMIEDQDPFLWRIKLSDMLNQKSDQLGLLRKKMTALKNTECLNNRKKCLNSSIWM